VVPGLSPSTFVPNPSLSKSRLFPSPTPLTLPGEDLPAILKQLAPGCFTPSGNSPPATPSHPMPVSLPTRNSSSGVTSYLLKKEQDR
jgi:hypothetical protein